MTLVQFAIPWEDEIDLYVRAEVTDVSVKFIEILDSFGANLKDAYFSGPFIAEMMEKAHEVRKRNDG